MPYSNGAQVELTGSSFELEERLTPITAELNEKSLRVNKAIWQTNLEAAEEDKNCLVDYCRLLTGGDSFRPNSTAECAQALFVDRDRKPIRVSKKTKKPLTDK